MDRIVGMMWNLNEGDILEEVIEDALPHLDSLLIADDGSSDNSWGIIRSMQQRHKDKIEHIQRKPDKRDKGQRQSLLTELQKRYEKQDVLVQIVESDIMILDTDIRRAWAERSNNDVTLTWVAVNAIRKGVGSWEGHDKYPNWTRPIKEVMPWAHWMEKMTYTFRLLPEISYSRDVNWRPWPQGFGKYNPADGTGNSPYTPLLAHYGYRGPTHMHLKYSPKGRFHKRYKSWDFQTVKSTEETVFFFNGKWNSRGFPMSRHGWRNRKHKMTKIPNLNTLADVIDRLIVEVNKLAYFENKKREEHGKPEPDKHQIAHWDNLSRDCCEYRSMLKNEINRLLVEITQSGEYKTLKELRTFKEPGRSVADILDERCYLAGSRKFQKELAEALENEF